MAAAAPRELDVLAPSDRSSSKILRAVARAPLNIFLIVVGAALARADDRALHHVDPAGVRARFEGLVEGLLASRASRRGRTTTRCSTTSGLLTALKTTAYIAVGNTLLVVVIGAMAGYAFAWLDFPGRDWVFIGVIALLVVPLQMALIPMFKVYDTFGLFDTWYGIALFHVAFGLPFAIFLLRNFFVGMPKDILESARIDGASRDQDLPAPDPAARPAGDRVARDLPVPLDVERPARRADVRTEHDADHRLDLRPAARVRDEHRHHRPGVVHLAPRPARRVLRLPALLRAGAARRLGEVVSVAIVGVRARRLHGVPGRCGAAGSSPARSPSSAPSDDPAARLAATGGGDPAAARCARRATGTAGRRPFPGSPSRAFARRRSLRPLVESACDRYHPTVEEFLAHVERRRERSGWDKSCVQARVGRIAAVDGGFEIDGSGRFAHVLVAPGHPGLACPTSCSTIRAPCTRTSRTNTPRR